MYLESVKIKKFRSVEEDSLQDCGNFNVLIGKNNSGKSNILSAIDAFFKCLKQGQVLTLDLPIGKEIDFFQKEVKLPIIITLSFRLSKDERSTLVEDIVNDSPQMKNAAEGLSDDLLLVATLKVHFSPRKHAFVSSLCLKSKGHGTDSERSIFSVDEKAANELFDRINVSQNAIEEAENLNENLRRIDEDNWRRFKTQDARGTYTGRFYFGNTATSRTIETAISSSDTFADFRDNIKALITKLKDESESIIKTPLENKLGTFSGEESSIPNYVQNLLLK